MAKGLYIGNGNAKKIKSLYAGVGNTSHKIKAGYIGVNGSAQLFYRSTYYTWNRYQINTVYQRKLIVGDNGDRYQWGTFDEYSTSDDDPYYSYCSESTDKILTNTGMFNKGGTFPLVIGYDRDITGITFDIGYYNVLVSRIDLYADNNGGRFEFTDAETAEYCLCIGNHYSGYADQTSYPFHTAGSLYQAVPTDTAGEFIDVVESGNPDTYPQNGKLGDYWYVYQGMVS